MLRKIISLCISFGLLFQQIGFAQIAGELNLSGYLNRLQTSFMPDKFRPVHLRYFSYDTSTDNLRILLDKGDVKELKGAQLEESSKTLLSYFLIGLSLPNNSFWVNLRPDSEDQVIDEYLSKTDVGKIMLAADLQLKKDTSLFTSPETIEGRQYWDRLYKRAGELFGSENMSIPTLTRPWIVPGEIIIRESQGAAYVYKATLKVMLEEDYLKSSAVYNFADARLKALNEYSSQLIRELIIPKLTKEVNNAKRYAALRQVYYSLVLSRWFKSRFAGKGGVYASLIDTRNLSNLLSQEPWSKTTYFQDYQKSFKEGEYNIKEPIHSPSGQTFRTYVSGGIGWGKELRAPLPEVADPLQESGGVVAPEDMLSLVAQNGNMRLVGGKGTEANLLPEEITEVAVQQIETKKKTGSPITHTWDQIPGYSATINGPMNPGSIQVTFVAPSDNKGKAFSSVALLTPEDLRGFLKIMQDMAVKGKTSGLDADVIIDSLKNAFRKTAREFGAGASSPISKQADSATFKKMTPDQLYMAMIDLESWLGLLGFSRDLLKAQFERSLKKLHPDDAKIIREAFNLRETGRLFFRYGVSFDLTKAFPEIESSESNVMDFSLAQEAFEQGLGLSEKSLENILAWSGPEYKSVWSQIEQEFKQAGSDKKAWEAIDGQWYTKVAPGTAGMRGTLGLGSNRINVYTMGSLMFAHALAVKSDEYNDIIIYNDRDFDPVKYAKAVAIGGDSREGSYDLSTKGPGYLIQLEALINAALGIRAYVYRRPVTTPQLAWSVHELDVRDEGYWIVSGSMNTASHNPSDNNGNKPYKFDGSQSSGDFAQLMGKKIENEATVAHLIQLKYKGRKIFEGNSLSEIQENISRLFDDAVKDGDIQWLGGTDTSSYRDDARNADEKFVQRELNEAIHTQGTSYDAEKIDLKGIKFVISPLYGASRHILEKILVERGILDQVIWVEDQPNPDFPGIKGGKPNPEVLDARIVALQEAIKENADMVLWLDPDGDRPAVAVKKDPGKKAESIDDYLSLNGNQQLAILTDYLIRELKDIVSAGNIASRDEIRSHLARKAVELVNAFERTMMASTVTSGDLMKVIARSARIKVVETLVGFKYIGDQIENRAKVIQEKTGIKDLEWQKLPMFEKIDLALDYGEHFLFGGEESLGSLSSDGPHDKDALAGVMWFVEIAGRLNKEGISFTQRFEDIYKTYGYFAEGFPMLTIGTKYAGVVFSEKEAMEIIKAEDGESILNFFRNTPPLEIAGKKVIAILDFRAQTAKDTQGNLLFDVDSHAGLITPQSDIEDSFKSALKNIALPAGLQGLPEAHLLQGIYSFAHESISDAEKGASEKLPKENFILLFFEDGSKVIARPSGTEPIIKMYVNARGLWENKDEINIWIEKAQEELQNIADQVAKKRFDNRFSDTLLEPSQSSSSMWQSQSENLPLTSRMDFLNELKNIKRVVEYGISDMRWEYPAFLRETIGVDAEMLMKDRVYTSFTLLDLEKVIAWLDQQISSLKQEYEESPNRGNREYIEGLTRAKNNLLALMQDVTRHFQHYATRAFVAQGANIENEVVYGTRVFRKYAGDESIYIFEIENGTGNLQATGEKITMAVSQDLQKPSAMVISGENLFVVGQEKILRFAVDAAGNLNLENEFSITDTPIAIEVKIGVGELRAEYRDGMIKVFKIDLATGALELIRTDKKASSAMTTPQETPAERKIANEIRHEGLIYRIYEGERDTIYVLEPEQAQGPVEVVKVKSVVKMQEDMGIVSMAEFSGLLFIATQGSDIIKRFKMEQSTGTWQLDGEFKGTQAPQTIEIDQAAGELRVQDSRGKVSVFSLDEEGKVKFLRQENKSGSPVEMEAPEMPGGIDFRSMDIITQPLGNFTGLNFTLPVLSKAELNSIDIEAEIQQIRNMTEQGILPSGRRIKELVAACHQKGQLQQKKEDLILCLVDICRLEEENVSDSSAELRETLVILDSQKIALAQG